MGVEEALGVKKAAWWVKVFGWLAAIFSASLRVSSHVAAPSGYKYICVH